MTNVMQMRISFISWPVVIILKGPWPNLAGNLSELIHVKSLNLLLRFGDDSEGVSR